MRNSWEVLVAGNRQIPARDGNSVVCTCERSRHERRDLLENNDIARSIHRALEKDVDLSS